ncbi:MAG: LPXTG cell wall anchor domain-containing protein [Clostridia bacterium]
MKKILAIVLASVMVFAIGATAFASIGFPSNVGTKPSDVKVAINLYDASADDAGNPTFTKHPTTVGILKGHKLGAKVTLTLPANFNPKTDVLNLKLVNAGDYKDFPVRFISQFMGSTDVTSSGEGHMNDFGDQGDNVWTTEATGFSKTGSKSVTYSYFFQFSAMETKDVKVSATYSKADMGSEIAGNGLTITKGGKDYNVKRDAYSALSVLSTATEGYRVTDDKSNCVIFACGAADKNENYPVNGVYFRDSSDNNYTVAIMNGVVAFQDQNNASWIYPSDSNYSALKKAFDGIMGALGFSMTSGSFGVLNDRGFEALAGSYTQVSATGTFYAYNSSLVVPGKPGTAVPDTGDNNVVGLVMIAISILAGAAVIVRKVRA